MLSVWLCDDVCTSFISYYCRCALYVYMRTVDNIVLTYLYFIIITVSYWKERRRKRGREASKEEEGGGEGDFFIYHIYIADNFRGGAKFRYFHGPVPCSRHKIKTHEDFNNVYHV